MLKISQKHRLLCTVMEVLGVIGVLVGAFMVAIDMSVLLILAGGLLWVASVIWDDRMYRCPHCGHYLKERNHRGIPSNRLFDHCPGCGWRVQIEIE